MQPDLASRLDALGFFRYSDAANRAAVIEALKARGWNGILADTSRLIFVDGEDLAEGGFATFLKEMSPVLEKLQVPIPTVSVQYDDAYVLTIGSRRVSIWTPDDAARENNQPGYLWTVATVRSFEVINDLLAASGTDERLYALYGGNELHGFFLTPELHRLITTHPDASERDLPHIPQMSGPWFRQQF